MGTWDMPAWAGCALVALAVSAGAIDLRLGKVPNWITYPAMAVGLVGHWITGGTGLDGEQLGLVGSLAGLAVGFLPMLFCWLSFGAPGGGDVKLTGAIGALGGWRFVLSAMLYGFIAGAVMALVVMVRRRLVRRTLRRVWRTLVLLVIPGARPVEAVGQDSPTIPFAVALCLGTAGAAVEVLLRSWLAHVP